MYKYQSLLIIEIILPIFLPTVLFIIDFQVLPILETQISLIDDILDTFDVIYIHLNNCHNSVFIHLTINNPLIHKIPKIIILII